VAFRSAIAALSGKSDDDAAAMQANQFTLPRGASFGRIFTYRLKVVWNYGVLAEMNSK
jgi:hypothetical protein